MRRLLLIVGFFLLSVPSLSHAQKNCVKGKACGNSCIARDKTCRIGTVTPSAPRPTARPDTTVAALPPLATTKGTAIPDTTKNWVASSRGNTYYVAGCRGAAGLSKANLIYFATEEDAKKAGLKRSVQKGC